MTRKLLKDEICQTAEQKSRSCSDRRRRERTWSSKDGYGPNGEIRTWPSSPSTTVRSFTTFRSWPMSPDSTTSLLKKITTGSCIKVEGRLVESLGSGQPVEVQAERIELYGTADPETYPLQKKGHTLESPARDRLPAPAHEHVRSRTAHTPRHGLRDTQVFQRQGIFLSPHSADHGQRRRGRLAPCFRSRRST